jgi:hypothetical protein
MQSWDLCMWPLTVRTQTLHWRTLKVLVTTYRATHHNTEPTINKTVFLFKNKLWCKWYSITFPRGEWVRQVTHLSARYTNWCSFFNNPSLDHHSHHYWVTRVEDELYNTNFSIEMQEMAVRNRNYIPKEVISIIFGSEWLRSPTEQLTKHAAHLNLP